MTIPNNELKGERKLTLNSKPAKSCSLKYQKKFLSTKS